MNRQQRRDHKFRRGQFKDRELTKKEIAIAKVTKDIVEGMKRVGECAGTKSGDDDEQVPNMAYDIARYEFKNGHHAPLRYSTMADYPHNPVPPYIWKSCVPK